MKQLTKSIKIILGKRNFLILLILIIALILRIWQLDKVPVSLFGDELDVGYQAYSILKTGKDYSGNPFPLHFESLADWRTPLYLYSSIPTVAIFGISSWGVRLPSAFFGVLGVFVLYLLTKQITNNKTIGLLSAFFLAISPWHLQYSRAGFEVTEMLFFYVLGIYFFLKGLKNGKLLVLASLCLGLTPWAYNTSKLFLPLTVIAIIFIWWRDIKQLPGKFLIWAVVVFTLIVGPFAWSTIFEGGTQRFQGISIFDDPTVIPQLGFDRKVDVGMRGSNKSVTIVDKLFHNQIISYSEIFINNYFKSFSTEFLFIKGDSLNLRQSSGTEFYKAEFIFLLMGLVFLAISQMDKKTKVFLIFWILASPIPSALTKGGGDHATRLILMLPVLIMLISFGTYYSYVKISKKFKVGFVLLLSISLLLSFIFYQHDYFVHYPWRSERWWHAGFKEAIESAVKEGGNYNRVIISSADEPSLKFFLGWSMYPPDKFQNQYKLYLLNKDFNLPLKLDKYEFPPIGKGINLYEMGSVLPEKTLYLATTKEINLDLVKEPGRVPSDIILVKSILYPSGKPAFYLFTKNDKQNRI